MRIGDPEASDRSFTSDEMNEILFTYLNESGTGEAERLEILDGSRRLSGSSRIVWFSVVQDALEER